MTLTLVLLGLLAAVAGGWLWRQGLASRPWLETGVPETAPGLAPDMAAKVGLGLVMAVSATLMALLLSAYSMRMALPDWSPPPLPRLLWANTAVLVAASLVLQRAAGAARRGERDAMAVALLAGGGAGLLFLLGQLLAWRQLAAGGYLPRNNPADAFFYLITAAHGLHLLGGLVALGRAGARLRRGARAGALAPTLGLCAAYWHFLLLAWLVLLATLAAGPSLDGLLALCTAPFR